MENFPGNSHLSKDREIPARESDTKKRVLKVVDNKVVRRNKPLGQRFLETFFGENPKGVMNYVIRDVLVPAAKDMFADAVSQGIERMIFGESRPSTRRGGRSSGVFGSGSSTPVNYNRYSARTRQTPRVVDSRPVVRPRGMFEEVVFATRPEADAVLQQMCDILEQYEIVTVRDFYEMCGENFHHTDENFGWDGIEGVYPRRIREGGYVLTLPQPQSLD